MAGVRKLRKIQLGREATAGTAVAATTIWRGLGTLEDQTEFVWAEEDVGYLSRVDRTYIPYVQGGLAMEEVEATFQQLPHLCEAGIKTIGGAADGTGSDYIYIYTFETTTANTLKTYTIEGGDNQQAEEMAYCFVTDFTLSGAVNEALKMSANWIGRQLSTTTFTGGPLALPAVEEILFNKGKLYVDASAGTHGTTQKTGTLLSATLNVDTGMRPVPVADGNLYFSSQKSIGPDVSLEIVFEHDATAVAEIAAWRAETIRLLQLKFEGSQFATPGTTYTYHTVLIDLTGKWENFSAIGERDGNDIVTGTFRAAYNATDAHFAKITIVNELAALP